MVGDVQMMRDFPSGNTPGATPRDSTLHMEEAAAAAVLGTLSIALSPCALELDPASALAPSASFPALPLLTLSAQCESVTSQTEEGGESGMVPRVNYLSSAAARTSSIGPALEG